MNLLIMRFSPTSYYFIPLRPNIPLSTLYSDTFCLYSSFNVRDQLSYPYKTTGNIMLLYILIFTSLDSRNEVEKLLCVPFASNRKGQ
jgi:hypothetical protein